MINMFYLLITTNFVHLKKRCHMKNIMKKLEKDDKFDYSGIIIQIVIPIVILIVIDIINN